MRFSILLLARFISNPAPSQIFNLQTPDYLPSSIAQTNLSTIVIYTSYFQGFPDFSGVSSLKSATFFINGVRDTESWNNFARAPNLSELTLRDLANTTFVSRLRSLEYLNIIFFSGSGTPVQCTLPSDIGQLINLTSLILSGSFTSLPGSFYNLTSLKLLQMTQVSGLTSFSPSLANLKNLESITITGGFSLGGTLPPLSEFPKLQFLNLQTLGLTAIPDLSGALSLRSLSIQSLNYAVDFPPVRLPGLPSLVDVLISNLPRAVISDIFVNATNLQSISMTACFMNVTLPDEIFTPNLRALSLDSVNSYVGLVPQGMIRATNLTTIGIKNMPGVNGSFPAPLGGYPKLLRLDLASTGISSLSSNMTGSPIESLYVLISNSASPLVNPPPPAQIACEQRVSVRSSCHLGLADDPIFDLRESKSTA